MTKEEAANLCVFLDRVDLKGNEAKAFVIAALALKRIACGETICTTVDSKGREDTN